MSLSRMSRKYKEGESRVSGYLVVAEGMIDRLTQGGVGGGGSRSRKKRHRADARLVGITRDAFGGG